MASTPSLGRPTNGWALPRSAPSRPFYWTEAGAFSVADRIRGECRGVAAPSTLHRDLTSASMVTIRSRATRVTAIAVTVVLAAALPACTPRPDGPTPAAERFFAALTTGDTS